MPDNHSTNGNSLTIQLEDSRLPVHFNDRFLCHLGIKGGMNSPTGKNL
jgi:hypothetical protein